MIPRVFSLCWRPATKIPNGVTLRYNQHILLKGYPTTLDEAVKDAVSIERALAFEDGQRIAPVQAVKAKTPSEPPGGNEEL